MRTRIRDVRKARGLTLAEVAARCDPPTTAQTIGRLETGMRTVSMGWLERIARALGVPAAELVTLPERTDLDVAAVLGGEGPHAPARPLTVSPPSPAAGLLAMPIEVSQGDYRAGDIVWVEPLAPERFAEALNLDVLAPGRVGRFHFGRLIALDPDGVDLMPPLALRPVRVEAPPWVAPVRTLVRSFA